MHIDSGHVIDSADEFSNPASGGDLSAGMRGLLRRQVQFAAGVALVIGVAYCALSLLFWNVADPSWSHATNAPVTNLMGAAGAIIADLFTQFLGLSAFSVLLIASFGGYAMIRGIRWNHLPKRMGIAGLAVLLVAMFFGTVPAPSSWPLPTGLGGVIGDLLLGIPGVFLGDYPRALTGFMLGLLLLVPAFYAMMVACGFGWSNGEREEDDVHGAFVGALMHALYSARATLLRALPFKRQPATSRRQRRNAVPEDVGGVRVEPDLDIFVRGDVDAPMAKPVEDLDFDIAEAVDRAMVDAPPEMVTPAAVPIPVGSQPRVLKPAAPPKQSARVHRDAQPNLIDDGLFELPSVHLLNQPKNIERDPTLTDDALEQNARLLEGVLDDFGVKGEIIQVQPGPVVTLYELEPAPGIKSSRVIGLAEDIARSMSAIAARVAVVPGRNAIGIELPNPRRETVYLRELISSQAFEKAKAKLGLTLGKTINGDAVIADLAKMPHLLVAGTTGSGKSVAINTMILSLLYRMTPEQCRLIMIDPKMLELSVYDGIPHLLTPVVTDPKKAVVALKWTVRE
ncbi:MAG: DNA translocase FtsK 4TM domain-containing protein, partial [Pseudomonadota bacterium]